MSLLLGHVVKKLIPLIKMLKVLAILLILFSCQTTQQEHASMSLYMQLGGPVTIKNVISKMIVRLHNDKKLSVLFVDVDEKELKNNLESFICHLTGGGCDYLGAEMIDVHSELFITKAEFDRFVSLFIYSMEDANIKFSAQNKLLALLAELREQVIEI